MKREIKSVLNKLESNGYEAYIVGGFVRDKILGINSYDVDICTNALPKEIHNIFKQKNDSKYGNYNLTINKFNIDITTYRKELKYENRKPVEIKYINNLLEDLNRRDFSMNTLCMNSNDKVLDLLGGKSDIKNKQVKMLGNIDLKINEDPLRILRAIRFATILDFKIDENLAIGIKNNNSKVSTLSKERIRIELNKILASKNYKYGLNLLKEYDLLKYLNITYDEVIYSPNILVMWSQINCNDNLFTNEEKRTIIKIKNILKKKVINESTLFENGLYLSLMTGELLGYTKKEINKMYKNMDIYEEKNLDITMDEIINIFNISYGKEIGIIKKDIINQILLKNIKNKRKDIIAYLSEKGSINEQRK